MARDGLLDQRHALADRRERRCVADLLVEARAAGDIGEQHGHRLPGGTHRRKKETNVADSIREASRGQPAENVQFVVCLRPRR